MKSQMRIEIMEKILVTGGSGFIGTNVVQFYLDKGFDVLSIDRSTPKLEKHIRVFKRVDIEDREQVSEIFTAFRPDYVIHLAARTDLDGKCLEDYSSNIRGVENILHAASLLPDLRKILVTSSMLVCHTGYQPKNQFDYAPTTIYGESKVKTEEIVWANKPKCDWAILRPTSIWGPWFGVPYRNFFDMVKARRYFHIGHKSCTKTYGYVGNAVYQIDQILMNETKDENNKVFYLGDQPPIFIEQWANEIAAELGFKVPRMPMPLLKCAAWAGDALKLFGIHFPMTSFRLKNMTTNNIIDLKNTYAIAANPPFSRIEGIKETLKWMENK